ncbi:WXG100 family type VII secretion target [Microbacterium sp. KSW2-21]|uniref:ESAT-6-like protein n=1 Tax=Microbacterium algihabitans TaxID=3075992 RepID=A0ABU3RXU6_9MICO|nr:MULTISPECIES: WXG100 family type VII secretion target [unclassified Microbacterium]MDU0327687.1 WXG100 family type VII secretion target [Microbacterium sp. KSW2-21]
MADRIRIDFGRVSQTVETLRSASSRMGAELDQLDAQLAAMESGWQGEAREAYSLARTRWEEQMRAMQALLDGCAEVLLRTGTAIADAESALARSF